MERRLKMRKEMTSPVIVLRYRKRERPAWMRALKAAVADHLVYGLACVGLGMLGGAALYGAGWLMVNCICGLFRLWGWM